MPSVGACQWPGASKLTAALGCLPLPEITATGLWHARTRLGVRPVRALFDLLRGPASAIGTAGAWWAGLLVVAIDGTFLDVPDDPATRIRLGKVTNQYAASGYPQILLVALVCCGTRAVIDAVSGPRTRGETVYGTRLLRSLRTGMIVLLDRGFASNAFLEAVAGTDAVLAPAVSLRIQKPPRRPTLLPGDCHYQPLDTPDQPLTSRSCPKDSMPLRGARG